MLDKQTVPLFDEMISYYDDAGELWTELDKYLKDNFDMKGCICFPYGNKYGCFRRRYENTFRLTVIMLDNEVYTF